MTTIAANRRGVMVAGAEIAIDHDAVTAALPEPDAAEPEPEAGFPASVRAGSDADEDDAIAEDDDAAIVADADEDEDESAPDAGDGDGIDDDAPARRPLAMPPEPDEPSARDLEREERDWAEDDDDPASDNLEDPVRMYLREIGQVALLTFADERRLSRRQEGPQPHPQN